MDSSLHIGKNDLLTFYDGDDLTANILGQYSGTRPHFKLYTSMADVTIQFQSDPATNIYGYNNGFVVHFFGRRLAFSAPSSIKKKEKQTTKGRNDQGNQSMEDKSKHRDGATIQQLEIMCLPLPCNTSESLLVHNKQANYKRRRTTNRRHFTAETSTDFTRCCCAVAQLLEA